MQISKSGFYDWLEGNTHQDTADQAHMHMHTLYMFAYLDRT